MKPTDHDQDKLLGYAYGELSSPEAKSLEAHLKSCPQCTCALEDIRKVRRTMAQLPMVPAPEAGLDSLLAYAQQAARRAQAGPTARSNLWKWVLLPSTGLLATVLLIVVSTRVAQETRLASLRSVAASKAVPPSPPSLAQSAAPQAESAQPRLEQLAAPEVAPLPKSEESLRQKGTVAKAESKAKAESTPLFPRSLKAAPQAPKPSDKAVVPQQRAPASGPVQGVVGIELNANNPSAERPAENFAQPKDEGEAQLGGTRMRSAAAPQASHGVEVASAPARHVMTPAALDREIARTRETLRSGTLSRLERARQLNHLCELLYAANRSSEADSTCDQVIRDFPGSAAADAARRLKEKNQPAPAR
jgi:hypothetical protein